MTDVVTCDGCSCCCITMFTPPGYSAVLLAPENWPEDCGDHKRVARLPRVARELLCDRVAEHDDASPCCWLDLENRLCRFHHHRPSICRDLEVGSEACLAWRKEYGNTLPDTVGTEGTGG